MLVESIIASVKTFGAALRLVRGDRTGVAVAAHALGANSTREERRDFANYLSKIERDKVPGVGLNSLRLIAKGLDLEPLSLFFEQIEYAQKSDVIGHSTSTSKSLRTRKASDKTTLLTQQVGDKAHGGSISPAELAAIKSDIKSDVIDTIITGLIDADKHTTRTRPERDREQRPGIRKEVRGNRG